MALLAFALARWTAFLPQRQWRATTGLELSFAISLDMGQLRFRWWVAHVLKVSVAGLISSVLGLYYRTLWPMPNLTAATLPIMDAASLLTAGTAN